MSGRLLFILSMISLFGLLFMINFTTPVSVGALGVLVFFTMIFILFFAIMLKTIKVFQKILSDKKNVHGYSKDKTYFYALFLAFGPLMLLTIQSSSSVTIFSFSLVTLFVVLGCFFVHKRI